MGITFKKGLEQGEKAKEKKEGKSAVLYGPPIGGKTSTLQYDKSIRVLLIDADMNSSVLSKSENVDIIGCPTYQDYEKIRDGVASGSLKLDGETIPMDYDLYVIDSFTRFEELIKTWVATVYAPNRKREIKDKFGAQTDWQDLQDEEVRQVRFWQALTRRDENPINILWIGHDMEVAGSEFDTVIQLRLQGKYAGPGIMGAVDGLFYMVKQWSEKHDRYLYGIATLDQGKARAQVRLPIEDRNEMPKYIWFPKWGNVFRQMGATNLPEVKE